MNEAVSGESAFWRERNAQTQRYTLEDKIQNRKFAEMSAVELGKLYAGFDISRLTTSELKNLKAAVAKTLLSDDAQLVLSHLYTLVNSNLLYFEQARERIKMEQGESICQ